MATQAKTTSPEWYWVDVVAELQKLVSITSEEYTAYFDLLTADTDMQLLRVGSWCKATLPPFEDLTVDDFVNQTYKAKMVNAALISVFYNLCEEVPDAMQQNSVTCSTGQMLQIHTTPIVLLPAQGAGNTSVGINLRITCTGNTGAYSQQGGFQVGYANGGNWVAGINDNWVALAPGQYCTYDLSNATGGPSGDNQSIIITAASDYTGGTKTFQFDLSYYLISV